MKHFESLKYYLFNTALPNTKNIMRELTIGIDIGGTNTKYGIVDRDGNVVSQGSISTTQYEEFKDYFSVLQKH